MVNRIILASGSPRRRELLQQIGIEPQVIKSTVEERITDTDPVRIVESLSAQKCQDVAWKITEEIPVLGADTIVVLDGQILGKPHDEEEAYQMLKALSGRSHQVYTGVTIIRRKGEQQLTDTFSVETLVYVDELTDEEIRAYIRTKDPMDKAGAYGIQGIFGKHISRIEGDYYNVVGLPVSAVYQHLKADS